MTHKHRRTKFLRSILTANVVKVKVKGSHKILVVNLLTAGVT